MRLSVLLLMLGSSLLACTGSRINPLPPQVELTGLSLESVNLFKQRVAVHLLVDNPNDFVISVNSVAYIVEINGSEVGRGTHEEQIRIAAKQKTEIKLPIEAQLLPSLVALYNDYQREGDKLMLDYRAQGNVGLDYYPDIDFDHADRVAVGALISSVPMLKR